MRVRNTTLPGVLVLESPVHADARGSFTEVYRRENFRSLNIPHEFAQDNHSRSVRGVLRGLHYQLQSPQGKLVRPVTGSIYDVAVDIRRGSPTYARWVGVTLESGDGRQLWIPPGFAHGFLVLSEFADVSYKCTTEYDGPSDRGIRWDDPEIGIIWPLVDAPLLSGKDAVAPFLGSAETFA